MSTSAVEHVEEPAAASAPEMPVAAADAIARLKQRLVARVASACAAQGWRRIALYGAGRHTRLYIRQPWAWHGVRVVAVLDDDPTVIRISGAPVMRPDELAEPIDAVVVSSDRCEREIAARAATIFESRNIPVLRIHGDDPAWEDDATTIRRLVQQCAVSETDARWLVANRAERHDATLPMLPPARTELHLRRYDLAAAMVRAKRVLDAACGTGYGGAHLVDQGEAASVVGVDIDAHAVAYARRRFGADRPNIEYRACSAAATGLPDHSVDVVTSFETIEHVPDPDALLAEFARVLVPGGRLIMSTPNDWGLTAHHVHSFTPDSLRASIDRYFTAQQWLGQRAGDVPALDTLPAGMFPLADSMWDAETLIVIARRE